MRTRKNELNVDFIGGEGPLTKEQEKLISEFIKSREAKKQTPSKTLRKLTAKKLTKKIKV